MVDEYKKQAYIKTLKDVGVDHPVVDMAEKFIGSYDGNNEEYLSALCFALTGLLVSYKEKSIKAAGYDQIKASEEQIQDEIEDVKITFQNLTEGILPEEPAVGNTE